MSLIKYNPFVSFKPYQFERALDDIAGRSISEFFGSDFVSATPSVNITEDEGGYQIHVAAPGLTKGDFDVQVEKDRLVIKAEKSQSTEEGDEKKYMKQEFNYTSFTRSFHLSDDVSKDDIEAKYADGILLVSLKKLAPEQEIKRTIEIG